MRSRTPQSGFTMLELMIAMAILATLLSGVAMLYERSTALFEQNVADDNIDSKASRTLARLTRELSAAGFGTLWPDATTDFGTDTLDYRFVIGSVAGVPTWGPTHRLAFEFEPGEVENGFDDNGNGLVDEGRIVRVENPGAADERRVVLANGITAYQDGEDANGVDDNGNGLRDERGLSFHLQGRELTIRLCIQRNGPGGRVLSRSLQTAMTLRN